MEMIRSDTLSGWEDVDLANAQIDDFRPIYALLVAIREREAACGGNGWWDYGDEFVLYGGTGYLNFPTVFFLRRITEAIHWLAPHFINLEPAVPYVTNHYQDFPVCFSSFDIEASEHPLQLLPMQGATAATPGALECYRRFLADAKFWLGRFRYVYAKRTGATKRFTSSASYWHGAEGSLEENFRENITQARIGRFSNGAAVYGDWDGGTYRGELRVYYENDGRTVARTELLQTEGARAEEISGVWVANESPIPADLFVFWGFGYPFGNETLSHPGTYSEHEKIGCEVLEDEHAEGDWGGTPKVVLDQGIRGDKVVERKWTYSPDGTQSKETTREWSAPTPSGEYLWDDSVEKVYTGTGWIHAIDTRTDFGELAGGESMAILPEKTTIDLPPRPSTAPPSGGYPLNEKTVSRSHNVGPITFHAVLDYGPHYRFP